MPFFFDIHFGVLFSQVIAAIGFGFIGLAVFMNLPPRVIAVIGLVIIFGHDALNGVQFAKGSLGATLWFVFMTAGGVPITENTTLIASYPYIPWMGVMLSGFAFGKLFDLPAEKRKRIFVAIGLGSLAVFFTLRSGNFYGNPSPWTSQKSPLFTVLSFINTNKYPPSLLFLLMTLGISILILTFFDHMQNQTTRFISVYGKVPFFYWMVHWFVIHFVAIGVFLSQGYHWSDLQFSGFSMGHPANGGGVGLGGLYLVWVAIVLFMWPISRAYGNYKASHRNKRWLSFL